MEDCSEDLGAGHAARILPIISSGAGIQREKYLKVTIILSKYIFIQLATLSKHGGTIEHIKNQPDINILVISSSYHLSISAF